MNVHARIIAAIVLTAIGLSVIACSSSSKSKTSTADLYATQTAQSSSAGVTPTAGVTAAPVTPEIPFAQACVNTGEKTFSAAPPRIIDTAKTYTATIKVDKGDIVLQLFSDVPISTNNFVFLSCKGFYDGLTFHRVLQDFMAQGGDPLGTGRGGPGYTIPGESSAGHTMDAGAISFAKSSDSTGRTLPDSAGSQFFITYSPQPRLETDFTAFGKVTSGMDVLKQITLRDPKQNPTFTGDKINTITITEQ